MKGFKEALFNGRLGRASARLIERPGSLRLLLARDTLGVMITRGCSVGLEKLNR